MHDRLYESNHSTVHMHCFKMTDIRGKKSFCSPKMSAIVAPTSAKLQNDFKIPNATWV